MSRAEKPKGRAFGREMLALTIERTRESARAQIAETRRQLDGLERALGGPTTPGNVAFAAASAEAEAWKLRALIETAAAWDSDDESRG